MRAAIADQVYGRNATGAVLKCHKHTHTLTHTDTDTNTDTDTDTDMHVPLCIVSPPLTLSTRWLYE